MWIQDSSVSDEQEVRVFGFLACTRGRDDGGDWRKKHSRLIATFGIIIRVNMGF
jgi:hypothetical protein